jgi:hypothetical protein
VLFSICASDLAVGDDGNDDDDSDDEDNVNVDSVVD